MRRPGLARCGWLAEARKRRSGRLNARRSHRACGRRRHQGIPSRICNFSHVRRPERPEQPSGAAGGELCGARPRPGRHALPCSRSAAVPSKSGSPSSSSRTQRPRTAPRFTWQDSSSPHATLCQTVWRETPRRRIASRSGTNPSGGSRRNRLRKSAPIRTRSGAPGTSGRTPGRMPALTRRQGVASATPSSRAAAPGRSGFRLSGCRDRTGPGGEPARPCRRRHAGGPASACCA